MRAPNPRALRSSNKVTAAEVAWLLGRGEPADGANLQVLPRVRGLRPEDHRRRRNGGRQGQ